jgi:hypothetical protein
MQAYAHAAESGAGKDSRYGRPDAQRPARWRAIEIVAMVVGFIVFWPVGLTILGLKIWQRRSGHQGALLDFAQEQARTKWDQLKSEGKMWNCRNHRADRAERAAGFGFGGMKSTGNTAFDDWRSAELARLEEERRKLEAAEREFSDYIESLRRAKDREEFDRFMGQRKASQSATDGSPN